MSKNKNTKKSKLIVPELGKLKRKRQTLRDILTKIQNKITEELNLDTVDIDSIKSLSDQLNEKTEQIFVLDERIEDAIDDLDELENDVIASQEIRDTILKYKSDVNKFLKGKIEIVDNNAIISDKIKELEQVNRRFVFENKNEISVLLPKLKIEPFDGNYENFQEFWTQFQSSIHENKNLSKVDKFSYLKSFLKGSALIPIQGLIITDKNYDIAVELIKNRFGKKDIIVRAHVNKLLNLTPIKSCLQLRELRNLCDICFVQVRSLEAAGVELNSYGSLLFPILLKLMPDEIVLEYNRFNKEETWDCLKFLEFLRVEIENREKTFLFRKANESSYDAMKYKDNKVSYQNKSESRFQNKSRPNPSAMALNVGIRSKKEKECECVFCDPPSPSVNDGSLVKHNTADCSKSVGEKRNALKEKGRCFLCFKKFHTVFNCYSKLRCFICKKKHNSLLCENINKNEKSDTAVTSVSGGDKTNKDVYLQTLPINLVGKNNKIKTVRALMDNGSHRTFVLERVSKLMKLKVIGQEELKIFTFGSKNPVIEKRNKVELILKDSNQNKNIIIEALETPSISNAILNIPEKDIKNFCDKNKINLADKSRDLQISILIGSDFYWKVATGRVRRLTGTLVASETIFGWTINGSVASTNMVISQQHANVMNISINSKKVDLHSETSTILRKFWELEALGIQDDNELSEENERTLEKFEENIEFKNDRYEVQLPWNDLADELADNFDVAFSRLKGLKKRFARNPEYFQRYKKIVDDYLERGIAEEVNEKPNKRIYFLPHQGVIREDKDTTKLRMVFDASSHVDKVLSLNDCLHSGPNLNPDLLGLLLQFREHRIAFTADIEQAFLQIALAEKDRDAVRFLWVNDGEESDNQLPYKELRMTRVIFGATSSPFLLAATIRHHAEKFKEFPEIYDMMTKSMYVDDLLSGTDQEKMALEIYEKMKNFMKQANFNMRKWKSNSSVLQGIWASEGHDAENTGNLSKVLGYVWKNNEDIIKLCLPEIDLKDTEISKRIILQNAGKIYDPIGFLNPFTVTVKILMQECWQLGLEWDEPLPCDLQLRFKRWINDLNHLKDFEISRHYFGNASIKNLDDLQLHCFADSSMNAYGAVIYIRYVENTKIRTSFVISKSRVSPLKKINLPRLELMAAVIGSRISQYVRNQLKIKEIDCYFWTDSNITLHWIKGKPNRWKPFVSNRVVEIQEKTDPSCWYHCPGYDNPADLLTRGENGRNLLENQLWWKGPEWLSKSDKNWPKLPQKSEECVDIAEERRKYEIPVFQTTCIENEGLLNPNSYSKLLKLLRVTAWCQRFVFNLKNKSNKREGSLTAAELTEAEYYWIKYSQNIKFADEIKHFTDKKELPLSSSILSYRPFLDIKGIMRVGGRLQFSDLNYEEKHPILLDGRDYLTELIIRRSHERTGHGGVSETLTDLREKFFILKGRQRVKSIIFKCNLCKQFKTKPALQDMASLPPDRVREAFPFEVTGLDYLGPLYVKEQSESKKCYVLLFTCATTRAVHLELTPDMTAPSFLQAFKKFICRRGLCRVIYSDNAKTFLKAKRELNHLKVIQRDSMDYFSEKGIVWKNIVEKAAWWGGFWERLVRSVKTTLRKVLGKTSLTYLELETVLIEVEAILNSRPLVYVSDETDSGPLTPGHFLIGRRLLSLPEQLTPQMSTKTVLLRRHKHQMNLITKVWNKWRKNYLLELKSGFKINFIKNPVSMKEGAIVQVFEDRVPKSMWKVGKIMSVHLGRDGKPRSYTIRLSSGVILKRLSQLLYPLELEET